MVRKNKKAATEKKPGIAATVSKKLQQKELDAWHIGVLLAAYNLGIVVALFILSVVSLNLFPMWVYLLFISPILFTVFWVWFSQNILKFYKTISLHNALLIAKISIAPFLGIFLISSYGYVFKMNEQGSADLMKLFYYYGIIFGAGSILLGLTVVMFSLRHRIEIKKIIG